MYSDHPRIARIVAQPRVGETIDVKFGPSRIISVHDHGRRLVIQTERHGVEHVERGERGRWTVLRPTGQSRTKDSGLRHRSVPEAKAYLAKRYEEAVRMYPMTATKVDKERYIRVNLKASQKYYVGEGMSYADDDAYWRANPELRGLHRTKDRATRRRGVR